ncbi:MAG: hypothetical protein QOF25_2237 [Mycobacterium sp.]|jgi:hypothetical protein|nr:hypothetical protein [Mycobacterium sp.]
MRVIVRKERPHPGAQLRLTRGQLPDLEMRNRRRARCDERIRVAKDTGLHNLPLHGFDCSRSPHASHVTPAELGSGSAHMPDGPNYSPWL